MLTTSSLTLTRKLPRRLGCAAIACLALLGSASAPALAANLSEAVGGAQCSGQSFSQPFAALGDYNNYTLVAGSEFASSPEGWELRGGAHLLSATQPDGSAGAALDLPSGSSAVSAPVCATLLPPAARIRTR